MSAAPCPFVWMDVADLLVEEREASNARQTMKLCQKQEKHLSAGRDAGLIMGLGSAKLWLNSAYRKSR